MGNRLGENKEEVIMRFNLFLKEVNRKNTYNKILKDKQGRRLSKRRLLDMFEHYIFEDNNISYRNNWEYLKSIKHNKISGTFVDLNLQYLDMKADEFKRWIYTKKDSRTFNESALRSKKRDYLILHTIEKSSIEAVMIKVMADEGGKINLKKYFKTIQLYEGEQNVYGYTAVGKDMMILYVKKGHSFQFEF